jgi:magnesium-transporting ATPase (P-type)
MDEQLLRDTPWHVRPAEEAVEALGADPERGLSADEAEGRLERFGPNTIEGTENDPWWRILLRQFMDPLIYILIAAGLLVLVLEEYIDAAVILAVVVLNGAVGFTQERQAQKSITALAEMSGPKAPLLRGGRDLEAPTEDVVPGDIVRLQSGVRVPADLRLLRADDLRVDEAALTGESEPVTKQVQPVADEKAVPGDQLSMAFAGTSVTRGRGLGVVVYTGEASQLGRIAEQTREVGHVETPIQAKMSRLGKMIGLGILALAGLVMVVGQMQGMSLEDTVQTAVAMAVGAVPEALPVVLTVALAVGVRRMAARHAIIRTLPSVETLGSTTVIGSDKTGTLTSSQMTVRAIYSGGRMFDASGSGYSPEGTIELVADGAGEGARGADGPHAPGTGERTPAPPLGDDAALRFTLLAGVLASETKAIPGQDDEPTGDPTELAVLVSGVKAGMDLEEVRRQHEQLDVIPFESDRQYMATLNRTEEGPCVFLKGAPESVLERCSVRLMPDGEEEELDHDAEKQAAHELADKGYRVLAMAFGHVEHERFENGEISSGLVFAGFQGMEDPLRPEAREAVEAARGAGIRVVMLTGDHADTARAIGRQLGLSGDDEGVREGREIAAMSDEELDEVVGHVNVYARVAPEHKLRLVNRLKARGEIVAVTGDGVNDAPALRAAHLGVAMGKAGTDVAREASDMVLTDDNFASITSAVEEGRLVFANIRKVTFFLLSTGVALVLTILASLFLGLPLPFVAVQVLWINLVTNGLQDVALAFEKPEPGLLDEPPRKPDEGVLNREVLVRLGWVAAFIAVVTMGVFYWLLQQDIPLEEVRSLTMTVMVMFQLFHVFNSRSFRRSVFRTPLTDNRFLLIAVIGALLAHVAALYLPFMQAIFQTTALSLEEWALAIVAGATVLVAVEIDKYRLRRKNHQP